MTVDWNSQPSSLIHSLRSPRFARETERYLENQKFPVNLGLRRRDMHAPGAATSAPESISRLPHVEASKSSRFSAEASPASYGGASVPVLAPQGQPRCRKLRGSDPRVFPWLRRQLIRKRSEAEQSRGASVQVRLDHAALGWLPHIIESLV